MKRGQGQAMNVSNINVGLTGENLLSIYNDFVSIKELNIESIEIKEDIRIVGSFTKGIVIKFECRLKVSSMENGLIKGEVTGFKILNIGISSQNSGAILCHFHYLSLLPLDLASSTCALLCVGDTLT